MDENHREFQECQERIGGQMKISTYLRNQIQPNPPLETKR
jgi:hypothetical protein